ncbi:MAG: helix-turn-helix domain-containing protein [Candidatus Saccharimonadales bacterium]
MSDDKITIQKLLKDLGFKQAEAETYWTLLRLDNVSIRKVAEKSGINRGTTYEAIKALVQAGLVIVKKSGAREYYTAESPEKIYDLIRDKRKSLWRSQQEAQKVIPEVIAKRARPEGKPIVKYYEDDEGVVTILKDVLQTVSRLNSPEYYVYSSKALRQYIYRKFPRFTERRIEEGVFVKVIAVGEGGDKVDSSERKWLPNPNDEQLSSYTIIYGTKVAHISISRDLTPYGVVIDDVGTANMQRLLFEQLWHIL